MEEHQEATKIKLVMLGDSGVGKTSIARRWVYDSFNEAEGPTIGAAYLQKTVEIDNKLYKVQLWDTAGEEKYRSMAPIYAKGANGALIVFDLTSQQSYDEAQHWLGICPASTPLILVGNKADLSDLRCVSHEKGHLKASELGIENFFEVSAVTGEFINDVYDTLVRLAISSLPTDLPKKVDPTEENQQSGGCWC